MKDLEKILKAAANKRRLAILKYLKPGEASVSAITKAIKLSFKSTSRHLAVLAAAEILDKEQRELYVFYRLAPNQHLLIKHLLSHL